MSQQLGALAVLPEDPVNSQHPHGSQQPFATVGAGESGFSRQCVHMVYMHACGQSTHTCKIQVNK